MWGRGWSGIMKTGMNENARFPGLIIAAPRSGAGKTTITLGLLRALRRAGVRVQPFKCGPDYIDPAFHEAAAGRRSYNLDTWAMRPGRIGHLVAAACADADLAVAEGVMGLFDGAGERGQAGRGATADLAALTGWPVVLVLDVSGQTETAAALALGCRRYRDDIEIAGVVLNRVASGRHLALIAPAFDRMAMPVFGAIPRDDGLRMPERHLGLVQASETDGLEARLDALADLVAARVDLAGLRQAARPSRATSQDWAQSGGGLRPPGQRIALARDRAFSFMYPHILHYWRAAGAEILPFSPLAGEAPCATADSVWLPGGYPELYAPALAAARRFKAGLRSLADRGRPVHGECGGYMVLGTGLVDAEGQRHEMAGLLDLETSFAERRLHLGYRRARLLAACALGEKGADVFGHEFHYARTISSRDEPLVDCADAGGEPIAERGVRRGSVTGTFFHIIDGMGP